MATFTAYLAPKSTTGGVSDSQTTGLLTINTSATIVVGVRQLIGITISGASDANGTAGAHVRFGLGSNPIAASTDFFLPAGQPPIYFDLGDEFDRVAFISGATTLTVAAYVMRMNRQG